MYIISKPCLKKCQFSEQNENSWKFELIWFYHIICYSLTNWHRNLTREVARVWIQSCTVEDNPLHMLGYLHAMLA